MVERAYSTLTGLAQREPEIRTKLLSLIHDHEWFEFADGWALAGRHDQLPPAWHWSVWLMLAGRGFGKTRAGAEWVHWMATDPDARIAIVGATDEDVRRVMVEGISGLLSTGPVDAIPDWEASRGILRWPNGAIGYTYSAANR
jgi:phage terminase large subunit-like protein